VPLQTQRGAGGIAPTYSQLRRKKGVGGQRHALAALPPEKTQDPLYRKLGLGAGLDGHWKSLPPLGFQHLPSRSADYDIPAAYVTK
jgi:hypothetical protein